MTDEAGGGGTGERPLPVNEDRENGAWGWGALGELEAFCRARFVDLVLGWTVVPGDESREAQRAGIQLLSSLSRQFHSDEMHIIFDEGVRLVWESGHTGKGAKETAVADHGQGRHWQSEESVGGFNRTHGLDRGLSSLSECGETPPVVPAATATPGLREGVGMSLTRFLSNVVVACSCKGTIVLDGAPTAAIATLQEVGYLPVELAFSLGANASSAYRLEALSEDGVVDGCSDGLSMLLGPAHPGYVCGGHRGSGSGRCEEACLSIRGALVDVARAVAVACRTGCGVKIRVSTTMPSHSSATPPAPSSAASSAAASGESSREGANLYYPSLLSHTVEFFGAGLCWRLDKASAALHLSAADVALRRRQEFEWGATVSAPGTRASEGKEESIFGAWSLHGAPDPAMLLITHVLRIDARELEVDFVAQLSSCLAMLLEKWSPFPLAEGSRSTRDEERLAVMKLDRVLWAMHAPGGNDHVQFETVDETRLVLKSLQRRYFQLEESSTRVCASLDESKGPSAGDVRSFFLEIHRVVRLLKISRRLLQATFHRFHRSDRGHARERSSDDFPTSPSSAVLSPSRPERRYPNTQQRGVHASRDVSHPNGDLIRPQGSPSGAGDDDGYVTSRNLRQSLVQLSSSTRLDFANRYLEEFSASRTSWDSTRYLSAGAAVLHASLSGILRNLAHDESAAQMDELCRHTVYNC